MRRRRVLSREVEVETEQKVGPSTVAVERKVRVVVYSDYL
jgi:hypothetical protein